MRRGAYFVAGGTLKTSAPSYIRRDADKSLFQHLSESDFCYVLTSRQVGKSSLVTRVADQLRHTGVAVAYLDLTAFSDLSAPREQWYASLISTLGPGLGLGEVAKKFSAADENQSRLARWQSFLREVVLKELPGNIVIVVDEIDYVRGFAFSTDEFFASIRACYNARSRDDAYDRLTFCLVGTSSPSDLISDPRLTPFNIGERIHLRDFTLEETLSLHVGLECEKEQALRLMKRVHYWTSGHPFLTQYLCQQIVVANRIAADVELNYDSNDSELRTGVASEADVDRVCAEKLLSPQSEVDNLSTARKRLLDITQYDLNSQSKNDSSEINVKEVEVEKNQERLANRLNLYRRILQTGAVLDDEKDAEVELLKLTGVICAHNGRLQVRNRIYRHVFDRSWIERNMPTSAKKREAAARRKGVLQTLAWTTPLLVLFLGLAFTAFHFENEARRQTGIAKAGTQKYIKLNYALNMQALQMANESGDGFRILALMNKLKSQEYDQYRGIEWSYWLNKSSHMVLGHTSTINGVTFSNDGKRIATAGEDKTAMIWDANKGVILLTLRGFTKGVSSVAFSPDDKFLLTGGYDNSVKLWDANTGKVVRRFSGHLRAVVCVAFSRNGKQIASAGDDKLARVWDVDSGREVMKFEGHDDSIDSMDFSPDGKRLATGSNDKTAKVWDISTGKQTLSLEGHENEVSGVVFSPDGKKIVTSSWDPNGILWDSETGRKLLVLEGHGNSLWGVAYSPDGKRIVTGSGDNTAKIWDAESGRELLTLKGHKGGVVSVAFSPDGKRVATASNDKTVIVWNAETGKETLSLKTRTN